MSSLTRSDRIIQGALMTSVAIVSVMALGIGYYEQQTIGMRMQAAVIMPMEDGVMPPVDMMKIDEPSAQPTDTAPAEEATVWCCNSDVALCYEQAEVNGCGKDAQYGDFETCADACK